MRVFRRPRVRVRRSRRYSRRRLHQVELLVSRFRYADRRVILGRARLFGDRIELVGWYLFGRERRSIPLSRIVDVDYHPLSDGGNLTVYVDSGDCVHLRLDEAHRWREFFEHWLRYDVLPSAKLAGDTDEVIDLSG